MRGDGVMILAHPFRDSQGRPASVVESRTADRCLAAWRQAELQGYEVVRWYISRRLAKRIVSETWGGPLREDMPVRLMGLPCELTDAPDGFGLVVRES